MLAGMTSSQLTEWMMFFKIENERVQEKIHGKKNDEPTPSDLDEKIKTIMGGIGKAHAQKHREG